jgi:small GTP-binding protein
MIQKKVCMVGVHGTGKTSLVQRYVYSIFSAKYHSTVGVKIDRKQVMVGETQVNLLLWDIEGRTNDKDVPASYLRGAHAVLFVADGTRPETVEELFDLRSLVRGAAGDVPSIVALNKADLIEQWANGAREPAKLEAAGFQTLRTSAKTGDGVEDAFRRLATAALGAAQAQQPTTPPSPPATRS